MTGIGAGLLVLAYLLAVVDGITQDKGTYPSSSGRTGFCMFWQTHPWIVLGAASGVAGTTLVTLGAN